MAMLKISLNQKALIIKMPLNIRVKQFSSNPCKNNKFKKNLQESKNVQPIIGHSKLSRPSILCANLIRMTNINLIKAHKKLMSNQIYHTSANIACLLKVIFH